MVNFRIGMGRIVDWRRLGGTCRNLSLTGLAALSLTLVTEAGAKEGNPSGVDPVVFRLAKATGHLDPGHYNVTRPLTAMVSMLRNRARKPGASNWVKYALSTMQDERTDIAFRQVYEAYVAENPSPDRFPISRGQAALHLGALALLEDRGKARGYLTRPCGSPTLAGENYHFYTPSFDLSSLEVTYTFESIVKSWPDTLSKCFWR